MHQTKLTVILHADVVGSTALVHRDEHLSHERIRDEFSRLAKAVASAGGSTQEVRGDALVAEFARASDAATAALDFQLQNQTHNNSLADNIRPELRVGIALGEVIIADGTVTGTGVILAQRLEQLAPHGGVCVSAAIREAIPARLALELDDLGVQDLKGIALPQHAYVLRRPAVEEFLHGDSTAKEPDKVSAENEQASIAVLPFENLSSDPEQEFFADGMAEDIITALSKFRWFFVIARNSSFTYSRQPWPWRPSHARGSWPNSCPTNTNR